MKRSMTSLINNRCDQDMLDRTHSDSDILTLSLQLHAAQDEAELAWNPLGLEAEELAPEDQGSSC